MEGIDFAKIEKKWQDKWEQAKVFEVSEKSDKEKYYVLEMYPYPSASFLHMGHVRNYTIGDVYARFKRMKGFNVLYPMGFDSFGLPAEMAAKKEGIHPKKYAEDSIKKITEYFKALGNSYDWTKTLASHEPEYYRWNQYFFLKMFEKGFAYRKKAPVNWCEKCESVLANEEAEGGKCWRCGKEVIQKNLEQWFFKITDYADRLLDDLEKIEWPERIKTMQKNWIGKSHGTEIDFEIETSTNNISNVVIVHGSPLEDRTKDKNFILDSKKAWIGWIKRELDKKSINCICPQMPTPWKPKYSEWKKEFEKIKIDENSILIGTSAGGGFLVRWLGETRKKIKKLILVSPGKVGKSDRLEDFYGDNFYNIKDFVKEKIVIYTSEDDINYHVESAQEYAKEFDGRFVKFGKGYRHFTSKTLVENDFPELLDEILCQKWPIFTTRPDTIYGVTFMVISAQHPDLMELVTDEQKKEVEEFLKKIKTTSKKNLDDLEKEGAFTGSYAVNPLTEEKVPIYVGNFVLAEYGSGMVMAVPAHDQRDFEFAKKYNIPVKVVINPPDYNLNVEKMSRAYTSDGKLVSSEKFDGWDNKEAIEEITKFLEEKNLGRKKIQYKIRDWLIARQRYWGTPIPIVYCDKCGIVPVEEKNLPVKLPEDVKFGKGNPLTNNAEWNIIKCPKCKGNAKRETDTMGGWIDSSWYFLRYCDNKNNEKPFEKDKVGYWMPVNQYIGGAEHAVMHLMYARFFTKVLKDLGFVDFDEPFMKLFNQGIVYKDGAKMSKSKGNVVYQTDISEKYGIDTARLFLMSVSSPDKQMEWDDKGVNGSFRIVNKLMSLSEKVEDRKVDTKTESKLNLMLKDLEKYIGNFEYPKAIISCTKFLDYLGGLDKIPKSAFENLLKVFSIFCPHIAEELWEKIGNEGFVSVSKWPVADESKIDEELEKQEQMIEKTIGDVNHILNLIKEPVKNIYLYVIPNELELYDEKVLSKKIGKVVKVFAVNDSKRIDPEGKASKAKPGKPGIWVE